MSSQVPSKKIGFVVAAKQIIKKMDTKFLRQIEQPDNDLYSTKRD